MKEEKGHIHLDYDSKTKEVSLSVWENNRFNAICEVILTPEAFIEMITSSGAYDCRVKTFEEEIEE